MKTTIEATAQSAAAALTIYVHLNNGHKAEFVQPHAQTARLLLDNLQPDRLFLQRQLVLAGAGELTTYSCAAIGVIELVTGDVPAWPHHRNVVSSREITREEFQQRPFTGNQPVPGPHHVFIEIEMHSGQTFCLNVEIEREPAETMTPLDFDLVLHHSFAGSCLHALRRDGGVLLINTANIVHTYVRSAPPAVPPSAWPARLTSAAGE